MELIGINLKNEEIAGFGKSYSYMISDIPIGLPKYYIELLETCNGGFTYDHFFHFLGLVGPIPHNVIEWNHPDLWKKYFDLTSDTFVFAQDIMGGQYFFRYDEYKNSVYMLSPSDGREYFMADNYDAFIRDVVDDRENVCYDVIHLVREYLSKSGIEWRPFRHITYKKPVYLGGSEHDTSNLELCSSIANLSINGQLLSQVKRLPKGTIIKDIKIDYDKLEVQVII